MKNKNLNIDKTKKEGVILSGYVRYRSSNKTYYLMVNSRILSSYISSKESQMRVNVERENKLFVIYPNKDGNIFKPRSRELVTCISGSKILRDSEIKFLKSKGNKLSFPIKAKISPYLFGLKKYYLYPDQDSAKLAYSLEDRGFKMPNRIMTPRAFKHDLVFDYKRKEIIIEITRYVPSEVTNRNFKHQAIGSSVWAHIFDVYRDCATDRINKRNKKIGFVVISERWKEYDYIIRTLPDFELVKCYVVFVDFFKKKWYDEASTIINKKIKCKLI